MTEQLPLLSVQLAELNVPDEAGESLKVTVPVGVTVVPGLESVIVAVQVAGAPTASGNGVHSTEVELLRMVAVTVVVPVPPLAQFGLARPYVPVIVSVPFEEGEYVTEHIDVSGPELARVQELEGPKVPPVGLSVNDTVP